MPNKFYILSGQGLGSVGAQLDNWGIVLDIFWTRSDQVRVKEMMKYGLFNKLG